MSSGPLRLRLATGNAASGRRLGRPYDLSGWAAAVADLDVDVLAVQEVDDRLPRSGHVSQTGQVLAALESGGTAWTARFVPAVLGTPGSHRTMRPATGDDPEGAGGYGVALLSRLPVEEWRELRMSPSRLPMPVPDEQRVAVAALLRTPVGPVSVVTTHLSFVPPRARAQLKELAAWAHVLPRPLVLLGDLNLPAPVPQRLTGWSPGVRAATFPAARPLVQLDHVLLDPGDSPARLEGGRSPRLAGSDHRGLQVELVSGPPDCQ